jgi:hypothetical protein
MKVKLSMEVTNTPTHITYLEVNGHKLEKVKQFKYLGTLKNM